jgi:hypothetical protein
MALEEFENEQNEKRKPPRSVRSIMNYGMGILWIGMGFFLLFPAKFGYVYKQSDDPLIRFFGGVSVLYGLFRIYRAYKKLDY